MDTVTIAGKPVSKRALVIVGGGAAAFVGWRYLAAGRTAATTTADTAPAYGLAGGTGQPEASGYGGAGAGSTGASSGAYSDPATNATWAQTAVDIAESIGITRATAADVIGRYLSGTYTQADLPILRSLLGQTGLPPVGGFGMPVETVQAPPSAPSSGSGTTTTTPSTGGGTTTTTPSTGGATGTTGGAPSGVINRPAIGSVSTGTVTVAKGQSWTTIAEKTGKTLDQLRAMNGGKLSALAPGQKVNV